MAMNMTASASHRQVWVGSNHLSCLKIQTRPDFPNYVRNDISDPVGVISTYDIMSCPAKPKDKRCTGL